MQDRAFVLRRVNMNKLLKRIVALLLCLMLWMPCALGEDCFTIDVDTLDLDRLNSDDYVSVALSASTQGVRIRKHISQSSEVAAAVRLTLTQMNTGTLLFDKNYGYQSGTFDSGVIYLPYVSGDTIPYLVTLYAGDYVYALPFMHLQRRMESNGACTAGVRLRDLDPAQSSDWLMGTMVDLADLRSDGSLTVDICASNRSVIGEASIRLNGSDLQVALHFSADADVELADASLYVIIDGRTLSNTPAHSVNEPVDVSGASHALVYIPMEVSYDPAGLPAFHYNAESALSDQQLWKELHPASAPSGSSGGSSSPSDGSGWDDGWSSGWDDGWDDGWSDGWSSGW